jgi:hypothetical protein
MGCGNSYLLQPHRACKVAAMQGDCALRRCDNRPCLLVLLISDVRSAARPKERRRYDAKCKELAKQLEQKVAQYNKLLPYGQVPGRAQPIMSDLRSQRFCWVEEYAG